MNMNKESTVLLVTGIGGGGFGEQILKALRNTADNLILIGTDVSDKCVHSDDVDIFFVVPPAKSSDEYLKRISEIVKEYGVSGIYPGSEPELKLLSESRSSIGAYLAINSEAIIKLCTNKYETYNKLSALGIEVPRYTKIDCEEDCDYVDYFPAILKPNTGSGGSSNVFLIFNKAELLMFTRYLLGKGIDLIAQEYVEGNEQEYTVGITSNSNGEVIGCVIMRRFLTSGLSVNSRFRNNGKDYVVSSGISQGEFIHDDLIDSQCRHIAQSIGSKGPLNIQGRFYNGQFMVFEINPRLSGTTSLRSMVGYNEPLALYNANVLGIKTSYDYQDRVVLRYLSEKIV